MLCFYKAASTTSKILAQSGLRALLYLDDGIIAVEGKEAALRASHKVRADRGWLNILPQTKAEWNGWALG